MSSGFKLDASPEFAAKIASIYAQFTEIEKKHDGNKQSRSDESIQKGEPKVLQDDEFSIPKSKLQLDRRNTLHLNPSSDRQVPFEFRRPKIPPLPKPKIPDHKLHPENWTKYSLASVEDSQMSDAANTGAALSYLRQQERRSQGQAFCDEDTQLLDLRAKVIFYGKNKNKSCLRPKFSTSNRSDRAKNAEARPADDEGLHSAESKHEKAYSVFGGTIRNQSDTGFDSHARVALSHLQEEDEEQGREEADENGEDYGVVLNLNDGQDGALKFSGSMKKSKIGPTVENGSSSSKCDDMPKLKRFRAASVIRSENDDEKSRVNSSEKS